jgi:hypothetical protein
MGDLTLVHSKSGVPIVYPRMSIAENILSSKFNPLNLVAKVTPNHLAGYTNKVCSGHVFGMCPRSDSFLTSYTV